MKLFSSIMSFLCGKVGLSKQWKLLHVKRGSALQSIANLVGLAGLTGSCLETYALFSFLSALIIAITICLQSAGFSGASDATRVSILLGLLKVRADTFA
jgi:hypothetical protein